MQAENPFQRGDEFVYVHSLVSLLHNFMREQNPHYRLPSPYPLDEKFYWSTITPT